MMPTIFDCGFIETLVPRCVFLRDAHSYLHDVESLPYLPLYFTEEKVSDLCYLIDLVKNYLLTEPSVS